MACAFGSRTLWQPLGASMIDLHAHLLPGVDDGPADVEASLALAQAAVRSGTSVMAATPHIGFEYSVRPSDIAGQVAELERHIRTAGIELAVVTGGELAPSRAHDLDEGDLAAIALGASHCVLLECPFIPAGDLMTRLVSDVQMKGFRVLLAHPERSPSFISDLPALAELVRRGAFVQITASSLRGDFGRRVRASAQSMLEKHLVHVIASDAHDATRRPPELGGVVGEALAGLKYPAALIDLFCEAAPRALLEDDDVPLMPRTASRKSWSWRRSR